MHKHSGGEANAAPRPFGSLTYHGQRVLLATGIVVGVVLLVLVLWYAMQVLLVAFAGVLLAILIRAPTDWLTQHSRLSETWSLAVVFLIAVLILSAVVALTATQLVSQLQQLSEQLPKSWEEFRHRLAQYPLGNWLARRAFLRETDDGWNVVWQATGMAYTAVQAFVGLLVLAFVTIYLAVQPRLYVAGLLRLVPISARPRAAEVLAATGYTLRWWLVGTVIRMVVVGALTYAGLSLLGMPLALVLAMLAFLLDFVPYFGPIIAAIPAILLAFLQGPQQALWVALVYIAVQQVESLLVSPVIYQRTVYLPPVLTIFAQALLFGLVGIMGLLLATPLMALSVLWVKMLYVESVLGDWMETPEKKLSPEEFPRLPRTARQAPPAAAESEVRPRVPADRRRRQRSGLASLLGWMAVSIVAGWLLRRRAGTV